MTKTKLHFSQKTKTKTKSKFAVKINTATRLGCTFSMVAVAQWFMWIVCKPKGWWFNRRCMNVCEWVNVRHYVKRFSGH